MATGAEDYLDLVRQAHTGDLKLPAFQREFKWTRKQVIRLYDSIRQSYPIGSIILLEGTKQELKERPFRGAGNEAGAVATKRLVLDGQQRITAGIDLFYGTSPESISSYFIDINRVFDIFQNKNIDLEDDDQIKLALLELDDDDGYCVGRQKIDDVNSLLNTRSLMSTTLLRPDNSKHRDHYLDVYIDKFPSHKAIVRNVIKPFFVVNGAPNVPYVSIESSLQLDSISRIFSTLNSSGKVLTPFELVVAVLFASNIDLRDDLEVVEAAYPVLQNMDATGEIVLQTAVMRAGGSPKKSLLPKNLTATIWKSHHEESAKLLSEVGEFMKDCCGMALDRSSSLIPYDSIFVPMAMVFDKVGFRNIPIGLKGQAVKKLTRWFVGSALTQRYQEGVHNKQDKDVEEMTTWLVEGEDIYEPSWLVEAVIPSLRLVTTKGAVANLLRCLANKETLEDPLTREPVNYGASNTHNHHIFPTKFVEKLTGWNPKAGDKADLFLNLMQLTSATNQRFLNDDPAVQIMDAINVHGEASVREIYLKQGIPSEAFDILKKADKNRDDFQNFIKIRETHFEKVLAKFGFTKTGGKDLLDELEAA